jgi:hypothetical protein
MLVTEQEVHVPSKKSICSLLEHFQRTIQAHLGEDAIGVRFVVTESDNNGYKCELGVIQGLGEAGVSPENSIFRFIHRGIESTDRFNVVMIIPTGIGAEVGGHAGDAAPAARLLAGACDTMITHPNVVNASDINELPENGLYVEGSVISRLLMGTAGLQRVRSNRVLLVIDEHEDEQISELAINSASAARATLGMDCPRVIKMDPPIYMRAEHSSSGRAVGYVEGLERILAVLWRHRQEFDAVAIASKVDMSEGLKKEYFQSKGGLINPWGGAEAMLTHSLSLLLNVPSAHAPMADDLDELNSLFGVVDPRMSAEAVSNCFLHCILKGLHRSPRIVTDRLLFSHPGILTASNVSCLVIPNGCIGLPTLAALEQGIPVIAVRENRNLMKNNLEELPFAHGKLFIVDNYLEAVGVITALKCGVSVSSVRRPLPETQVTSESVEQRNTQARSASQKVPSAATAEK